MGVHALDHARVEPDACREGEVPIAGAPEVDPDGLKAVGHSEEVLGGVHDVRRYAERPAQDVGRPTRKDGQRGVAPNQPVRGLVHRAVPAERDDDVVALGGRLAADLRRVRARLGINRLDGVAPLQRIDHQVL